MNFVICGLPRSGTTIIARFVGGLPGVTVVHEPLQVRKKYGVQMKISTGADHAGIKEPFHYVERSAVYPNLNALDLLKSVGWKFIWVVRHYSCLKGSLSRWGWSGEEVYNAIEAFLEFKGDEPHLDYDAFCRDPIWTWNALNPIGVLATEVRLAPCSEPFMGDWKAKDSTEILRPA